MLKSGKTDKNNADKRVDTFIGRETSMQGSLEAKGLIHIEGHFQGDIYTEGEVVIGAGASVKANVKGNSVNLAGSIEGNVEAVQRLLIRNGGVLLGDIKTGALAVEDGALFKGNCKMKNGEKEEDVGGIGALQASPDQAALIENGNSDDSSNGNSAGENKNNNDKNKKKKKRNRSKK